VDVVPYQVTIGEKWLKSGATHPEPRGRPRRRPGLVDWGRPRRPLTLLAVGFGSLAFAVTAQAGIDNSDPTTAAPAAPPPTAAAAPVGAPVPTSDAMTTAAAEEAQTMTTAAAEEAQTVVSPQYRDENAVAAPPPAADVPPTPPDDAPAVDDEPEGSTSAPPEASDRPASPPLITDAGSPPNRRAAQEDESQAAQPSPSASTPQPAPPVKSWYRDSNSQYQFTHIFRKAASNVASDVSVELVHGAIDRSVAFAQSHRVEEGQIRASIPTSIINANPPIGASLLTSISPPNPLETGTCRALPGGTSGCATARQRYHAVDPRYRTGRSVPEAVSKVLVSLDETAQQLAIRRTDLGRFPSPQPANVRATTPGEPMPVNTSGSFVSQGARAALTRTVSGLTGPRLRDLPAVSSAGRIARGLGASLLPRLDALPRPRDLNPRRLTGGQVADSRRMLQIGLALGIAYLVFLTFWFWGTRGRHRGLRGGTRL
jgi:hypothetical protein